MQMRKVWSRLYRERHDQILWNSYPNLKYPCLVHISISCIQLTSFEKSKIRLAWANAEVTDYEKITLNPHPMRSFARHSSIF